MQKLISKKYNLILLMSIIILLFISCFYIPLQLKAYDNNANLTEGDFDTYLGNLLLDENTANAEVFEQILDITQGDVGEVSSYKNTRDFSQNNSYFVKLGTHPTTNKPIYWQIVCRTNDYITLMMSQCYTVGIYSSDNNQGEYADSQIRETVLQLYSDFVQKYPVLNNFIVTPAVMEADTGIYWQSIQSDKESPEGMDVVSWPNFYDMAMTDEVKQDAFWIPSVHEVVFNQNSSTETQVAPYRYVISDSQNGIWGLNFSEQFSDDLSLDGQNVSQIWLRGLYGNVALSLSAQGTLIQPSTLVSRLCGIRPAFHISLKSLGNCVDFNITSTVYPENAGIVNTIKNNYPSFTVSANANEQFGFVGWSIDGGKSLLSDSLGKPNYTFKPSIDLTLTAVFENFISVTSQNPDQEFSIVRETNDGIKHSYLIKTLNANYISKVAAFNNKLSDSYNLIQIKQTEGYLDKVDCCLSCHFIVNNTGDTILFEVYGVTSPMTVFLEFVKEKQNYSTLGNVNGVAVSVAYDNEQSNDGISFVVGQASIQGFTNTSGVSEISVVAKACDGYKFLGWQINGEFISYLNYNNNNIVLVGEEFLSAKIPLSLVNNKQIVALFGDDENFKNVNLTIFN